MSDLVVPLCDGGVVREHTERIQILGDRDRTLERLQERQPGVVHQIEAVLLVEAAHVGDECGDQQHVAWQRVLLDLEVLDGVGPTHVL